MSSTHSVVHSGSKQHSNTNARHTHSAWSNYKELTEFVVDAFCRPSVHIVSFQANDLSLNILKKIKRHSRVNRSTYFEFGVINMENGQCICVRPQCMFSQQTRQELCLVSHQHRLSTLHGQSLEESQLFRSQWCPCHRRQTTGDCRGPTVSAYVEEWYDVTWQSLVTCTEWQSLKHSHDSHTPLASLRMSLTWTMTVIWYTDLRSWSSSPAVKMTPLTESISKYLP